MSISNYLNKLITIKNDLVNILKPFNSSITSSSKYDELVTSVRDVKNDLISHCVTYNDGTSTLIFDKTELDYEEFNYPVTIGNKVTSCRYMLEGCYNFNQLVVIPDKVFDCSGMFNCCYNFNQPITIPNRVTNCSIMFATCENFNQPVNIPNRVTNCYRIFYECYNFNQPINIPNSVINCSSMFDSCYDFNQPINIPNSVTNCSSMFEACDNFNHPVTIGISVTDCSGMFCGCLSMSSNVYIKSRWIRNCDYMFNYKNTSKRINIHIPNTNNDMINLFTNTSTSYSITGEAITYTHTDPNLYYNTAKNIYIYTNYTW